VRSFEKNLRRNTRFESLFPSERAETPTVTGLESWKAVMGHWCGQIIAALLGKLQKFLRDFCADDV
jgi:hypothetical protein